MEGELPEPEGDAEGETDAALAAEDSLEAAEDTATARDEEAAAAAEPDRVGRDDAADGDMDEVF